MWFFRRPCLTAAGALIAGACATTPAQSIYARALGPSYQQGVVYSDFLAARFSALTGDYQTAAHYFRRVALDDPSDAAALDRAVVSSMLALQVFEAAQLAGNAPSSTLAGAPFSRVVLAADAMGQGADRRARGALAQGSEGPLNEDIAATLRLWLTRDGKAAALPDSIRPAHRELILGLWAAANDRPVDWSPGQTDSTLSTGPPWVVALRARLLATAGDPVRARTILEAQLAASQQPADAAAALARLASGTASIHAPEASAASVWLLADETLTVSSPELRVFYAALALAIDPQFEPARFALAEALAAMDRTPEAVIELGAISPDSPYMHDAAMTLAELELRADDTRAAAQSLAGIDWRMQRRDLRLRAGEAFRKLEMPAEAEALFASVVAEDSQRSDPDWRPLLARADVLRQLGRWPEAEDDLERAMGIAPDQPMVLNDLGFAWADRGENLTEALGLLQRAAAHQPRNPSILDSLGWVHSRLGNDAVAVEFLEQAAGLAPDRADILDHLGDVNWRLGRFLEAEYAWRRALDLRPSDMLATRLRGKLSDGLASLAPTGAVRADAAGIAPGFGSPDLSAPVQ